MVSSKLVKSIFVFNFIIEYYAKSEIESIPKINNPNSLEEMAKLLKGIELENLQKILANIGDQIQKISPFDVNVSSNIIGICACASFASFSMLI